MHLLCALATVVQEPSRNSTTLHLKSLLKHWRSYPRCDRMGLHYHLSWLLMDRLFISTGFTTSLISSLLSLTKVLLFHSGCKKNTSEASRWALDRLCYQCALCAALWLAGWQCSQPLPFLRSYTATIHVHGCRGFTCSLNNARLKKTHICMQTLNHKKIKKEVITGV